jgi:hypothetical protein
MRALAVAALITALLPATAYTQEEGGEKPTSLRSKAQKKEDAEIEKAYQQMINRTKDQGQTKSAPEKYDPWQNLRAAPADSAKR